MPSVWSALLDELRRAMAMAVPTVPSERITFATPPSPELGDVAVPCFQLARELEQPPPVIAARIVEAIGAHPLVRRAAVAGPYVNITFDAAAIARRVLAAVAELGERYGETLAPHRERIVLEFVSPNANKPLHLGHLRNAFLGASIARLLAARGHTVHRVCLVNDRGVHIMKSMLAYQKWGHGTTPESEGIKGDHFVGNWYVAFEQKASAQRQELGCLEGTPTPFDREAAELLRKWEAGDPEVRALWARMTNWVLAGFRVSYATLGVSFEREYRESDLWEKGRAIVREALDRVVFTTDERGNVVAPLEERFGIPDKVVERADGTTVYATQDLALAIEKVREFHPDRSIVITASEQQLYFRQLFAIFELLRVPWAASYTHRSYGMVMLPEGRMKSREGTIVDADDLIAELTRLAEGEIRSRADAVPGAPAAGTDEPPVVVSADAFAHAQDIALAAVKFYLLLVTPETIVMFDPKASLAFTGKTGPYLQYAHARICSIQRKDAGAHRTRMDADHAVLLVHPFETQLLLAIARFPDIVATAADQLDPSTLAQYLYDVAQRFADFYHDVPVLRAASPELRAARLALVDAVRMVLARGLTLLGIAPLEAM